MFHKTHIIYKFRTKQCTWSNIFTIALIVHFNSQNLFWHPSNKCWVVNPLLTQKLCSTNQKLTMITKINQNNFYITSFCSLWGRSRYLRPLDNGLVPAADSCVSMRTQTFDVPPQEVGNKLKIFKMWIKDFVLDFNKR